MSKFEILDDEGNVINRIKANRKFVEEKHPGRFREIIEPEREEPVVKTDRELLEEIITKLDELLNKGN